MKFKHIVYLPLVVSALVLWFCILRTLLNATPKDLQECQSYEWEFINRSQALKRFMTAINFQTISWSQEKINTGEILKLHNHLKSSFPGVHNCSFITKEVINKYSLLYYVAGTDSSLRPYMLTAHLDVVPANSDRWTFDPFNSTIEDGYIYGRGTIDDKQNVMGMLEAVEYLIGVKYRPKRSFYLAFGHDEEVQGLSGARKITEMLQDRNVTLEFVLDEGLVVTDRILPGLSRPLALIGVTEKGYVTVELKVDGIAGHSSMPPPETAIGILAKALTRLEMQPHPNMLGRGPERDMFESIAPHANLLYCFVYSNVWLLSPIMAWVMSFKPTNNALVRTTTAITIIHGGQKENIIPDSAYALVNHRIHPVQTVYEVVQFDKLVINDDRVNIAVKHSEEPHPVSRHDDESFGYNSILTSIRQVFQNAVVAPGVVVGNTDSRWYIKLTPNVYRFSPSFLTADDVARLHGDDERILVENYFQVIKFYHHLVKNVDQFVSEKSEPHGEL